MMGSGFCPEFCHISTMYSKCKYCYFYYFMLLLMGTEGFSCETRYFTQRGKLSAVTDQNREDGRNAISSELLMNHTALAIICLHIVGFVMCW